MRPTSWLRSSVYATLIVLSGCATTGESTASGADPKPAAQQAHPDYGDDAMGVALRWTAGLPDTADNPTSTRVADGWDEPTLTRLVRRADGRYTAVVTDSDVEGATVTRSKALIVQIERRNNSENNSENNGENNSEDAEPTWTVTGSEVGSATAFWPTTE